MTTQGSPPVPYSFIPSESEQENPNKLFLGGISAETTEKQLEHFFSQFGKVKDVRIVTDRVTAACKGYGFVTYEDDEDVEHLVERKTIRMSGTKLRVRKAIRRNASQFDHVSPSNKWMMVPPNLITSASSTPFMTPPNTPPSAIEQMDINNAHSKPHVPGARFLFKGKENMDGYPVLITHGRNAVAAARSRTNSSPSTALQPPSIIIPDEEPCFFFPTQLPQTAPPQALVAAQHNRVRTCSMPITLQDYEAISAIQHHHNQQQQQQQQQAFLQQDTQRAPPQTLLMTADQTPSKYMPPSTITYSPPPPQCHPQTHPGSQPTNPGYLIPFYHQQTTSTDGSNLLYCLPPQPNGAPQQPIMAPPSVAQYHPVPNQQSNMYK